jgi:hypothetical protein
MSACNKSRFPAMSHVISRAFAQAHAGKSTKNTPESYYRWERKLSSVGIFYPSIGIES